MLLNYVKKIMDLGYVGQLEPCLT